MAHYNFRKDLKEAKKTEILFAELLEKKKFIISNYNNDYRYDIKAITPEGKQVTFEIKEDFLCKITGNVAVEFECRGKSSGIQTTQANFYVYRLHEDGNINFYYMAVSRVKKAIKEKKYFRTVKGGDKGSDSMNYLFDINDFKKFARPVIN